MTFDKIIFKTFLEEAIIATLSTLTWIVATSPIFTKTSPHLYIGTCATIWCASLLLTHALLSIYYTTKAKKEGCKK